MFILKNIFFAFRKSVMKNFISKFLYVLEYKKISKTNIKIFPFFFKFWISEIIIKKNISFIEKKRKFYQEKYFFQDGDWFSHNIPVWEVILNKEVDHEKKTKYLEIGSWEGRSVVHICEKFKNFQVTVVDPYMEYKEIDKFVKKQNIDETYNTLKKNLKNFSDRVEIYRTTSKKFFENNQKKYNLIYIDGSHKSKDVEDDFLNSLKILEDGGLIILDDFTWNHYENICDNPIGGILPVLKKNEHLKIISASNQLIVKN